MVDKDFFNLMTKLFLCLGFTLLFFDSLLLLGLILFGVLFFGSWSCYFFVKNYRINKFVKSVKSLEGAFDE